LLRLIDARFTNENQARLGMVEANMSQGPIWFNVNPDLTLSLDDDAPEKALTLRINTSRYHMIEGSRPLTLVYRIYYKLFKTNLNPQALIKDPQDQTLLLQASREDINVNVPKMIKWEDIKLPEEWNLLNEMPPTIPNPINIVEQDNLESVMQYHDGTVKIRFNHSKPRIPSMIKYSSSRRSFSGSSSTSKRDQDLEREKDLEKYLNELNLNKQKEKNDKKDNKDIKDIKLKGVKEDSSQVNSAYYTVDNKTNEAIESDNESLEPTASDILGETDNQLNVIKKHFEINWEMLNSEFDSEKNKGKREKHRKTHDKEEKQLIFNEWKSVMQDLRMNIHFFDFVDKYYLELKELNVLSTLKWTKENKTIVESSYPPKENILINVGNDLIKASPFKKPPTKLLEKDDERKIIEQNNYTNKCLNVISDQLDKIENKIDSINIKPDSIKIETPLIKAQELKTDLSLKTSQTKTREKIDQMLKELNKVKGEPSTINVINKNDDINVETCSSNSETTSEEEIDKLEKVFGKL
jgi:hypothetical protein